MRVHAVRKTLRRAATPVAILAVLLAARLHAAAIPSAEISHPPVDEVSGLVRSSTYPGVFWAHNDSGDVARIFALRADGSVLMPAYERDRFQVGGAAFFKAPWPGIRVHNAANIDWEDIALSDGYLYIADLGNNGNARRDLGVYVVPEPSPEATADVRALRFLPVRYPEQQHFPAVRWHYDCEALFVDAGRLYFLTKHRRPGEIAGWESGTRLYRLDTDYTERDNVLTLVGEHAGVALATAADLSPDGTRLAVLTYPRIWVFERPAQGDNWLNAPAHVLDIAWGAPHQVEGITWIDANTLLVAGESRALFKVPLADFAPQSGP